MAQAAQHPGHEVLARPHEVLGARLAPGAHRERVGLHRLQVVGHVQGAQHHAGDLVVAEGVVVQAVGVEEARILHLLERPLVGDDAVVPVGDRADVLVVDRDLAAECRGTPGVKSVSIPVKTTSVAPSRRRRATASSNCCGDLVRVGAGADDVVAARARSR